MLTGFQTFLILLYLFFFGSIAGWGLELLFRRFISRANPDRQWLNPGFLIGPYLPLYGTGTVALFALSSIQEAVFGALGHGIILYGILFFVMALAMTVIEYIAGLIFIKGFHVKLWDYTGQWGNIQGIICPKFTLIWGALSIFYYLLLYPPLRRFVEWFVHHPLSSFSVGMIFGIFLIDCGYSMHLGTLLRRKANEIDAIVDMQAFQRERQKLGRFFQLPRYRPLTERLDRFDLFLRRTPAKLAEEAEEKGEKPAP